MYVDDLILTGNNDKTMQEFLNKLSIAFSLKDLRALNYFLGVEVVILKEGLCLTQQNYVLDLLGNMRCSMPSQSQLLWPQVLS